MVFVCEILAYYSKTSLIWTLLVRTAMQITKANTVKQVVDKDRVVTLQVFSVIQTYIKPDNLDPQIVQIKEVLQCR